MFKCELGKGIVDISIPQPCKCGGNAIEVRDGNSIMIMCDRCFGSTKEYKWESAGGDLGADQEMQKGKYEQAKAEALMEWNWRLN